MTDAAKITDKIFFPQILLSVNTTSTKKCDIQTHQSNLQHTVKQKKVRGKISMSFNEASQPQISTIQASAWKTLDFLMVEVKGTGGNRTMNALMVLVIIPLFIQKAWCTAFKEWQKDHFYLRLIYFSDLRVYLHLYRSLYIKKKLFITTRTWNIFHILQS